MAALSRLRCRLGLAWLVAVVGVAVANVEKDIFVAPSSSGSSDPSLSGSVDLVHAAASSLPRLTPDRNAWRTGLPAMFPWAETFPANGTTWVLLDELSAGQRYELRVCWAATQPTTFAIDVFDFATVASTPDLTTALGLYASMLGSGSSVPDSGLTTVRYGSSLLLRIVAAADYVAVDRTAMQPDRVAPVLSDVILDPFLLNVLPRSLLPIVGAVLAVAAASAWFARCVALPQLLAVVATAADDTGTVTDADMDTASAASAPHNVATRPSTKKTSRRRA